MLDKLSLVSSFPSCNENIQAARINNTEWQRKDLRLLEVKRKLDVWAFDRATERVELIPLAKMTESDSVWYIILSFLFAFIFFIIFSQFLVIQSYMMSNITNVAI